MLPSTITDFNEALWTPVEEINDGVPPHAELLLKPYTWDDRCELLAEFGICTRCSGDGELIDFLEVDGKRTPTKVSCPACGGKVVDSTANPAFRRAVLARILRDWRFVRGRHPLTGVVSEVEFGERARDGLAAILSKFMAVVAAAMKLAALQDAEKKGSTTQLFDASPAAATAAGNEA